MLHICLATYTCPFSFPWDWSGIAVFRCNKSNYVKILLLHLHQSSSMYHFLSYVSVASSLSPRAYLHPKKLDRCWLTPWLYLQRLHSIDWRLSLPLWHLHILNMTKRLGAIKTWLELSNTDYFELKAYLIKWKAATFSNASTVWYDLLFVHSVSPPHCPTLGNHSALHSRLYHQGISEPTGIYETHSLFGPPFCSLLRFFGTPFWDEHEVPSPLPSKSSSSHSCGKRLPSANVPIRHNQEPTCTV